MENLIGPHGGYKKLKTFQISQLVFDLTVRFCNKFVDKKSRTNDQMVQAARSGVQNIAEGSQGSATSKKSELKLTNVARASLEELKLDYQDFLRQRKLPLWAYGDPRGKELVQLRLSSENEFALWVKHLFEKGNGSGAEIAANGILVLLSVACTLLDRQIKSLADNFKHEGGFTEKLYHMRMQARKNQ